METLEVLKPYLEREGFVVEHFDGDPPVLAAKNKIEGKLHGTVELNYFSGRWDHVAVIVYDYDDKAHLYVIVQTFKAARAPANDRELVGDLKRMIGLYKQWIKDGMPDE